jgi:hypothetical protein
MRRGTLWFLTALLGVGCGGPRVVPVSGVVTLDGHPLAHASVSFQPISPGKGVNPGPGSLGETDDNGAFTLRVVGVDRNGAYVGRHRVEIAKYTRDRVDPASDRGPPSRNLVPPKYNLQTTLTYEVPPGGTDRANFDLSTR